MIDNSVWARLSTTPAVGDALKRIAEVARPRDVLVCPPVALEYGFGARTSADHARIMQQLSAFADCQLHPTRDEVLLIQHRLWGNGLLRAAGALDTLIAAYAVKNEATLLHYDRDFEHIASVAPAFRQLWVVPPGSI